MTVVAALATALAVYLLVGWATGNLPQFRRMSPSRPQASSSQQWLVQAGVDVTPRQFWLGSWAAGLGTFVLLVFVTAVPAVAVVPAAAVGLLPRAYFARRRAIRLREITESWPDGVRDLLASISAGMSMNQAVTSLAATGPEPLRRAFSRYGTLARMVGVVPALEVVKEELADPTSDRVIEVLILAHERGGHILPDILRDLAEATTKDVRALEEIATDSLEQRINARAVFVLPWAVLLLLTAQEGAFRDFYRSPAGLLVVAIGGLMSLLGLWLVARLSREQVEQRVLGAAAPISRRDGEVAA